MLKQKHGEASIAIKCEEVCRFTTKTIRQNVSVKQTSLLQQIITH